ncbi:hypothetical protein FKM82_020307 [Ascaphus truei]
MIHGMSFSVRIFLVLALALCCVRSQIVLSQSGPEVAKPGTSVRLSCSVSGFSVTGTWMYWVRQKPGAGLEWLVYYLSTSNKYYLPSISDRFTASKDSSNLYLQMNNLKPEDTAMYYCARDTVTISHRPSIQKHPPSVRNHYHH